MADVIFGNVSYVVDGDTLDIENVAVSRHNNHDYSEEERVRLSGCDAPELGSRGASTARGRLEHRYLGQRVRVDVSARDIYGRVIGHITLE